MEARIARMLAATLVLSGCDAGGGETRSFGNPEEPVAVTDEALARSLSSKKLSEPVLCKADTCLVPELGTDLDAVRASSDSALAAACYDGQNYCSGGRCYACCNNTWYNINTCRWGVYFSCNGQLYDAVGCWPCCK